MEFIMKSQKGVTLVALVIYIIVFTIVISILSVISSFFFSNVNFVKEQANYAPEFNKFNIFIVCLFRSGLFLIRPDKAIP